MVSLWPPVATAAASCLLLGQAGPVGKPLLEQLDPERRALVLMALLGIALFAVLMVLLIWMWGRRVRRLARHRTPVRKRDLSDWDRKQPVMKGEFDANDEEGKDGEDGGDDEEDWRER